MKTLLLTGFEPFGGAAANASAEIVRELSGRIVAGWRIEGAVLPCAFRAAPRALARLLERHRPGVIVCLGEAAGRGAVTPELIAVNHDDARIADNAGHQPVDTPVVSGGPAAYWSSLPVRAIVAELSARGIPATVSRSAGGFVCNHVFYALMHRLARRRSRVLAGFIHVPTAAETSWAVARSTAGVAAALDVTVRKAEARARTAAAQTQSSPSRRPRGRANKRSPG